MVRTQRQRVDALGNGGGEYPAEWDKIAAFVKEAAGNSCVRCRHVHDRDNGFVMTVHHLTMEKSNCQPWNLAALCQRCHLRIQGKVDFLQPYMGAHSPWMLPFVEQYQASLLWPQLTPLSVGWQYVVRFITAEATRNRPPCICPGWIYQRPDDQRDPECEAHGKEAQV